MAALLRIVDGIDYGSIKIPTLFVFSPDDKVVSAKQTGEVIAQWGGPATVFEVRDSTDPYQHVIAGDALSPNTTGEVETQINNWLRQLN